MCLCVQPQPPAFSRASPGSLAQLFPAPLRYSVLIIVLFFSAGKELREDNKDYQQVLLDVQRSLRRFPPGERGFSLPALRGAPPGSDLTRGVAAGDAPLLREPDFLESLFLVSLQQLLDGVEPFHSYQFPSAAHATADF